MQNGLPKGRLPSRGIPILTKVGQHQEQEGHRGRLEKTRSTKKEGKRGGSCKKKMGYSNESNAEN